ncbi:MAG TPA: ABC transporter ATP-binding protein [Solirubrobacteraceae bacterium]|nr:ABC transporter ATP-binding protein [Solirubrobacteraceae bacterium]
MDATADIVLQGVTKRFGDLTAVDSLDLAVPRGSFFALLGPSGCGKTTTLRMIGGFEDPTEGTVLLGGQDVTDLPPFRRDVNTVFQSYALFPHLDVQRNVAFGLERRRLPKGEVRSRVAEALELTQLTGLEKRRPNQLSGGQQQRVALARALVNRPRALLLDEPLGALDLRLRRQLQIELKRIQNEVGLTFVHVTHDQEEAMTMADEIAVMNEGRIEQRGSASELYEAPATAFVASFLGVSNLVDARMTGRDGTYATFATPDGATVRAPADRAREGAVRIGVRPEKLEILTEPREGLNALRGRVEVAAYLGVSLQYVVRTPGGEELTVIEQNRAGAHGGSVGPGRDVLLAWRPEHTFVVDKEIEHAA